MLLVQDAEVGLPLLLEEVGNSRSLLVEHIQVVAEVGRTQAVAEVERIHAVAEVGRSTRWLLVGEVGRSTRWLLVGEVGDSHWVPVRKLVGKLVPGYQKFCSSERSQVALYFDHPGLLLRQTPHQPCIRRQSGAILLPAVRKMCIS